MSNRWTIQGRKPKRATRPAAVALTLLAAWVIAIYAGLVWFMHRDE
jgi:hypothetical protein